jgi:hypothetical protein
MKITNYGWSIRVVESWLHVGSRRTSTASKELMVMTWPDELEHHELLVIANRLVDELRGLRGRLRHANDTEYAQHGDCADRARNLAEYLRAAVLLASTDAYAPAFASVRTALEHMLVDHLVFSGQRYVRMIVGVGDATWTEWQRQRTAGEGFTQVLDWLRKKDTVEITYEGLRSAPDEDGQSYVISPHYFLLRQYQPYLGPPSAQAEFDDGIGEPERDRQFAKENDLIYRTYLSWSSIKRNLTSNSFADDATISKLEVHYRFLSAFVHPLADVTDVLYGRNNFNIPSYDHYSSELTLLYVIAIAVEELRHFREMTQRHPAIEIASWQGTDKLCKNAWREISYLWFPGQKPHMYDRIQEANRRAFRVLQQAKLQGRQLIDPMSIPDEEIRYYRDPMRRLVDLHSGFQEIMTGLSFTSPWPRDDARLRL